ncbi:MAG: patatin-like phospholipase family protein [Planctomycetota bacterium]|jgi:hypothetical protein
MEANEVSQKAQCMMGETIGETKKPLYTTDFTQVLKAEQKHTDPEGKKKGYYGLALSGGGIRSASFGLGVLQALFASDKLKKIDYLSTVSGGGYIGSSLTWFLQMGIPKKKEEKKSFLSFLNEKFSNPSSFQDSVPAGVELSSDKEVENFPHSNIKIFPFGRIGAGGRTEKKKLNAVLDYIRQHGNYIMPGKGLDAFYLFGVVFRSMIISLFMYLLLLTTMLSAIRLFQNGILYKQSELFLFTNEAWRLNWLISLVIIIFFLILLGALAFSLITFCLSLLGGEVYRTFVRGQMFISYAWKIVVGLLLLGSLPYMLNWLGDIWQLVAAGSLNTVGIITALFEYRKAFKSNSSKPSAASDILAVVGSMALLYGLLLIAFMLADGVFNTWRWCAILAGLSIVFGILVNLNYVGFARVYRDRLMETFLPNDTSVLKNQWGMASIADKTLLKDMCQTNHRPYHLINTNVVLVNSPTSKYRGRGGDSFLLSPLYCGSDATGWRATDKYMKFNKFGFCNRGITLATAMAISGAAVNPNAAPAGRGLSRNRFISLLMDLVNLRLGYWASNPAKKKWTPLPPNFITPGIGAAILGLGFTEKNRTIELSDGGHFENFGLYELIRRKCRTIIVSDATADPKFRFGDLANAIERVRVDFGAKIRFDTENHLDIDGLLPGSAKLKSTLAKKYRLAERAYALADITYDDKTKGKLIYIKTTLTPGLPADIYGYKSDNLSFPDQSTADQFFDEHQFEAYRELGYKLTEQMNQSDPSKDLLAKYLS